MKPHNSRSAVGLFTKETSPRTGFSSLASHWFFRMSAVIVSIQSGNSTNSHLKLNVLQYKIRKHTILMNIYAPILVIELFQIICVLLYVYILEMIRLRRFPLV